MNIHDKAIEIRKGRKESIDKMQQEMQEYIDKQRRIIIDSLFEDIFKSVENTRIGYKFELEDPTATSLGINLTFFHQKRALINPETVVVNICEPGMWKVQDPKFGKPILNGNMDQLILLLDKTFYSGVADYPLDDSPEARDHQH